MRNLKSILMESRKYIVFVSSDQMFLLTRGVSLESVRRGVRKDYQFGPRGYDTLKNAESLCRGLEWKGACGTPLTGERQACRLSPTIS